MFVADLHQKSSRKLYKPVEPFRKAVSGLLKISPFVGVNWRYLPLAPKAFGVGGMGVGSCGAKKASDCEEVSEDEAGNLRPGFESVFHKVVWMRLAVVY